MNQGNVPAVIEVIARGGNLNHLNETQSAEHYFSMCEVAGLNPSLQPFEWLTLKGRRVLYAKKTATDELRRMHGIDIKITGHDVKDGILRVHAVATDKHGRSDEDWGVVSVGHLKGEDAANAFMKAVTKAKRRVTLSICGLGILDESEIGDDDASAAATQPRAHTPKLSPSLTQDQRSAQVDAEAADSMQVGEATQDRVPDQKQPSEAERAGTAPCRIGIDRFDDAAAWSTWATLLLGYIRMAPDATTINDWTTLNAESLAKLKQYDAAKHQRLIDMIGHQMAIRNEDGQ